MRALAGWCLHLPVACVANVTWLRVCAQPCHSFKLVAMKCMVASKEHMESHYADLSGKGFFNGLVKFMTSGPVIPMVWEGLNVVKTGRKMLGETNPADSLPGSIRGDFCIDVGRNIIHGSDSVESANKEIALWFPEGVQEYKANNDGWVYE